MYPHRIRLRGPWEWENIQSSGPTSHQQITRPMPWRLCEAGLAGYAGLLRLVRKFGYPGRIDAFERVWLTFSGVEGMANEISLNNQVLGREKTGNFEFDVTVHLQPHNRLEVVLRADSDQATLGEVALEIRCVAYLSEVRAHRLTEGAVEIHGNLLGGQWDQPLDLYVMLDDNHVHHRNLKATGETQNIQVILPAEKAQGQYLQVDLACGPIIWHRVEMKLE